jgi:hypothetical protein
LAILLSALDIVAGFRRVINFVKSSDKSFRNFWRGVVQRENHQGAEYTSLDEDTEETDLSKGPRESIELQDARVSDERERGNKHWVNHQRHYFTASEQTVFDAHSDDTLRSQQHQFEDRRGLFSHISHVAYVVAERALVFAGYGQFIIGIVTYTGTFGRVQLCPNG